MTELEKKAEAYVSEKADKGNFDVEKFGKDAEEIMMQKVIKKYDCIMTPCKTLEDCQLCDFCFDDIVDAFKDGAEFGYNKANEWHYVKDGLPEELHDVLCFVIHNEHRYVLQGYLREGRWVLSPLGTYLNNDDVIAWKEIVLPKESE